MNMKPAHKFWMAILGKVVDGVPKPTPEYKFLPDRQFLFDFCWVKEKVAVEIEGGEFIPGGGRHQRARGFTKDCEKYNLAQENGWIVLRYTGQMVQNNSQDCLRQVARVLKQRGAGDGDD